MRLPIGKRRKPGSCFDFRIMSRTRPKRRQKAAAEATASAAKSSFSKREKCCGSAKVGRRSIIGETSAVQGKDTRQG
jgi:hypothetical protein